MASGLAEVLPGAVAGPAVAWYVAMLLVGGLGLVPASVLFEGLGSRGIFVARPLALALMALLTWLTVRLTGLEYGTPAVLGSAVALAVAAGALAWWRRPAGRALLRRWPEVATAEAVTAAVFLVVLVVRVQAPDAWATEKPADLMLLTAVHRAEGFPPADPWLAGETLSYYHLGQLQADHLARLAGVTPAEAFNLVTATAGAMAAAAAAGLAADIVRLGGAAGRRLALIAGGVALAGLLLVAPLVGLVQVLAANGVGGETAWGVLGVEGVPAPARAAALVPDAFWWWWPTTRVVPDVISEYPAFTLILGDPHAHLLALPLGLTALALAVQVFAGGTPLTWRRWLARPETLVLTSAVFAALVMTNSWDVVTYGALWAGGAWWAATRAGWPALLASFLAARWAFLPVALALALAWPFLGMLDPQPLGLAPVVEDSSDLPRWLLFWLPALLPGLLGAALLTRGDGLRRRDAVVAALVVAAPVVLWAAWLTAEGHAPEIWGRGADWLTVVLLVGSIAWLAALARERRLTHRGQETALALLAGALAVLLVTEFFYIDDLFPGRLNTAFKFWFQAWAIASVAGGALAALALEGWLRRREAGASAGERRPTTPPAVTAGMALAAVIWVATMVTPPLMAVSRARESQEPGLSATAYLEGVSPGMAEAIAWGLEELDPAEHVAVESVDESYGDGNKFSATTAVPTLLGWPGHERQWRSEVQEEARRAAVEAVYLGDGDARAAAVRRWGITHVLLGPRERALYGEEPPLAVAGWPVVFESDLVEIFEVPAALRTPPAGGGVP